jgi:hypothetical protein
MKLIMTLLVRDVDDIIGANLDFHLACGVDHVLAMDNLSTDGTKDILRSYERRGVLTYISQPEDTYQQARWVTQMARQAYDLGADWVINNDADEFWYTPDLDIKSVLSRLSETFEGVAVARENFVPQHFPQNTFFAEALTLRYLDLRDPSGKPWPGKICHRGHPAIEVGYGNHTAAIAGRALEATTTSLEILHFPIRSYEKFERNIINGGQANARNPDRPVTRWSALYELWERGELRRYFDSLVPGPEAVRAGLEEGRFAVDERLKATLKQLQGS